MYRFRSSLAASHQNVLAMAQGISLVYRARNTLTESSAGKTRLFVGVERVIRGGGYEREVLRVTIRRLRQKLEEAPHSPSIIKNVLGVGYVLGAPG